MAASRASTFVSRQCQPASLALTAARMTGFDRVFVALPPRFRVACSPGRLGRIEAVQVVHDESRWRSVSVSVIG